MYPWETAQLGLLNDPESLKYKEYADSANLGLLADMTPVLGDIKGAYDFAKEPGLLSGLGLLPFIPNITDVINTKKGIEVLVNPTSNELRELYKEAYQRLRKESIQKGEQFDPDFEIFVRWIKDKDNLYAFPGDQGIHKDVVDELKLPFNKVLRGTWFPDTDFGEFAWRSLDPKSNKTEEFNIIDGIENLERVGIRGKGDKWSE